MQGILHALRLTTFLVTAYTCHPSEGTGDCLNKIEAIPEEGVSVACPRGLPIGTRLRLHPGEHLLICDDRGGAITRRRLDLYLSSRKRAFVWGRRVMWVTILPL